MANLNELEPNKHMKILIFGESGTGKTCFASGFPGPIHYADFDLKVSSAASFLKGKDKLNEISYDAYPLVKEDMGGAGKKFNEDMGKLKKTSPFPYGTLVIDSLTTLSDRIMEHIMRENPGVKRNITRGAQAPALQDYGLFRIFMKQFIGELISLPCNLIVIAHIDITKDETTGATLRIPMLTGKLARELPIYFEEVYMAFVEGEGDKRKYRAQTQTDRKFSCRTQRGLPQIIDLDYKSLVK